MLLKIKDIQLQSHIFDCYDSFCMEFYYRYFVYNS